MREKRVECPKCKKAMNAGYVLSHTKWEKANLTHWAPGVPKLSMWTGLKVDPKLLLPVTTYRCGSCGFLESYART